jgi:hypothetical protein
MKINSFLGGYWPSKGRIYMNCVTKIHLFLLTTIIILLNFRLVKHY